MMILLLQENLAGKLWPEEIEHTEIPHMQDQTYPVNM